MPTLDRFLRYDELTAELHALVEEHPSLLAIADYAGRPSDQRGPATTWWPEFRCWPTVPEETAAAYGEPSPVRCVPSGDR